MTVTEFLRARIEEDEYKSNRELLWGSTPNWTKAHARRLDECKAWRTIIAECREDHEDAMASRNDVTEIASVVLYALATVHAEHPDYQQEWAK